MANYYTREVVTKPLMLTDLMVSVLQMRGAEVEKIDESNVLDSIVAGQMLYECIITFESGWDDNEPEELLEWHDPETTDEDKAEFDRLLAMEKIDFFREVLKVNSDANSIQLQAAWTCDRMRLDGFGGSSCHISRKGYMYVSTTDVDVDDDGTFHAGAQFYPWEEDDKLEAA